MADGILIKRLKGYVTVESLEWPRKQTKTFGRSFHVVTYHRMRIAGLNREERKWTWPVLRHRYFQVTKEIKIEFRYQRH